MMDQYAVLTGDIIKSRKLAPEQLKAVRERIGWAVSVINTRWESTVIGEADFYRGDGWQLLLGRAEMALRAALMIRTSLIAFENADSRAAIGIGAVEFINSEHISQSMGRAFELSGKVLDGMKPNRSLDLLQENQDIKDNDFCRISIHLCDSLVRLFTTKQAEAVFWALQGYKQVEIAEKMNPPVKQPTAAEHLIIAGWSEIESLIGSLELTL